MQGSGIGGRAGGGSLRKTTRSPTRGDFRWTMHCRQAAAAPAAGARSPLSHLPCERLFAFVGATVLERRFHLGRRRRQHRRWQPRLRPSCGALERLAFSSGLFGSIANAASSSPRGAWPALVADDRQCGFNSFGASTGSALSTLTKVRFCALPPEWYAPAGGVGFLDLAGLLASA